MKSKLFAAAVVSVVAFTGLAEAAVTVSVKNFTSASAGVPIVDAAGAAVAKNTIFASAGIFSSIPDWGTATSTQVLSLFTAIDAAPLTNGTFTGLFTGSDQTNLPYPSNFSGALSYILVGNAATLANSTAIAVYSTGTAFTAVDGAGNATVALNGTTPASWVYGISRSVTTQPATLAGAAFTTGIQLTNGVAIPEPSAALLGAIGAFGLLRRRRI